MILLRAHASFYRKEAALQTSTLVKSRSKWQLVVRKVAVIRLQLRLPLPVRGEFIEARTAHYASTRLSANGDSAYARETVCEHASRAARAHHDEIELRYSQAPSAASGFHCLLRMRVIEMAQSTIDLLRGFCMHNLKGPASIVHVFAHSTRDGGLFVRSPQDVNQE